MGGRLPRFTGLIPRTFLGWRTTRLPESSSHFPEWMGNSYKARPASTPDFMSKFPVVPRPLAAHAGLATPAVNTRRDFLKTSALGGVSLGALFFGSIEEVIAERTSRVNRASSPSQLKITDLRYTLVEHLGRKIPLIRLDNNQGIHGLGEVRDGGDERYALILKSRLIGKDPCNVEKVFKTFK